LKRTSGLSARRRSRGFTLIELTVALAISTILAVVYESWKSVETAETAATQTTAQYLLTVRGALAQYQQDYFTNLSNGTAITGYANSLAPTIAELKADSLRLPSGLPSKTPGGQSALIQITRTGTCPGTTCQINGLVYLNGAFTIPRTGTTTRMDLAIQTLEAMNGAGGVSTLSTPGTISGGAGSATNPVGSVAGVVGAFTYLDNAFWQQFVRINDTRDPNLQGNLTVAGNETFGGTLAVTGATTLSSTVAVSGAATLGNTLAVTGATTLSNGVTVTGDSDVTGRVVTKASGCERVVMDPSGGSVQASNTSCVKQVVMDASSGTIYANNTSGTTVVKMDGGAGRVTSQMGLFTATATANASCGTGYSAGDMVRDADTTGTILVCQSGVWKRPGLASGTEGSTCSVDGSLGQDSTGAALICRSGAWSNLSNRVTKSVLMARYSVYDGNSVPEPTCGTGGTASILVTPEDVAADYSGTPPRNRFTATVTVSGSYWIVNLRLYDSSGVSYTSSPAGTAYNFQAMAQTFCDYST
jgi:prepilin-type N-terminal cleavage/methylation domain-containing protein